MSKTDAPPRIWLELNDGDVDLSRVFTRGDGYGAVEPPTDVEYIRADLVAPSASAGQGEAGLDAVLRDLLSTARCGPAAIPMMSDGGFASIRIVDVVTKDNIERVFAKHRATTPSPAPDARHIASLIADEFNLTLEHREKVAAIIEGELASG